MGQAETDSTNMSGLMECSSLGLALQEALELELSCEISVGESMSRTTTSGTRTPSSEGLTGGRTSSWMSGATLVENCTVDDADLSTVASSDCASTIDTEVGSVATPRLFTVASNKCP